MPSLNIKNEDTVRLVRELSERTGKSMTSAIHVAVCEKLERERPNPKAGLAQRLMAISRETAAMMDDGRTSKELIDELYDSETGLPV